MTYASLHHISTISRKNSSPKGADYLHKVRFTLALLYEKIYYKMTSQYG